MITSRLTRRAERSWAAPGVPGADARREGRAPIGATGDVIGARLIAFAAVDGRGRLPLAACGGRFAPHASVTLSIVGGTLRLQGYAPRRAARVLDGRSRLLIPAGWRHLAGLEPATRALIVETGGDIWVIPADRAATVLAGALKGVVSS